MANLTHLRILRSGMKAWNQWRKANPGITPYLHRARLEETDLRGYNLKGVNLSSARLTGAQMRGVDLTGANLSHCHLEFAILSKARLVEARLYQADRRGASLRRADLRLARVHAHDAGVAAPEPLRRLADGRDGRPRPELDHEEAAAADLPQELLEAAALRRGPGVEP